MRTIDFMTIFGRAIFSFSHELETDLVGEFLGPAPGFFVDVGANDPKHGSQSWHLEQRGWNGILIEPQPHLAERLRQQRKAKVYEVACSAPANAGKCMSLYCSGMISSLDKDWSALPRHAQAKVECAIEVTIRTLDQVLTDAKAPTPIDFISIDVEGHTDEVLDGFDLTRWRPRLILLEDHVITTRVHRRMLSADYRWMRRTGLNGWYVPAEAAQRISLIGRLQFFRKYVLGVPLRRLREQRRRPRS
jgi:FkbM family methyltransferase